GYGITLITFGPNRMYFHGGEMPGYNSFMGHDPDVSLDGAPPANRLTLKILDQSYNVSPLR
ncbi:MAG: hypothetical protein WBE90_13770, partial [Xanthobacteraceae bacterium]